MSNRGQGSAEAVIPISSVAKFNSRAEVIDGAAQTILGTINRAATTVQASYRRGWK